MPDPVPAPVDPLVGADLGHESSLSNWAGDYVTDMLGRGWAMADAPYQAYKGPLTAGASDLQQTAFGGIGNLELPSGYGESSDMYGDTYNAAIQAGEYNPMSTNPGSYDPMGYNPGAGYEAMDSVTGADYQPGTIDTNRWNDQFADHYMSPYIQEALAPQLTEVARQADIQRLQDASRLTKAGAYGGSRQAVMESEGNDNMQRLMAELLGKGYQDAYESGGRMFTSDEGRMLQADVENERAKQFGADLGMRGDELMMRDRQFGANLGLEGEGMREQSRQFGANLGLQGAGMMEDSRQFGAGLGIQSLASRLAAAEGTGRLADSTLQGQRDIFGDQLEAGGIERAITQAGIDADRQQFEEERDFPYRQAQYMHSLLDGMPLSAQSNSYADPSTLSTFLSSTGGISQLYELLFGNGAQTTTQPGTAGTETNPTVSIPTDDDLTVGSGSPQTGQTT